MGTFPKLYLVINYDDFPKLEMVMTGPRRRARVVEAWSTNGKNCVKIKIFIHIDMPQTKISNEKGEQLTQLIKIFKKVWRARESDWGLEMSKMYVKSIIVSYHQLIYFA